MRSHLSKRAQELRQSMTLTEIRLWSHLRGRQLGGWKFRRQAPIGHYIVDFYCPAAKLVIELNGASHVHEDQFDYDNRRQAWLESQGYKVMRFSALYPEQDYLDGVWEAIELELEKLPAPAPRRPHPRVNDPGRPLPRDEEVP